MTKHRGARGDPLGVPSERPEREPRLRGAFDVPPQERPRGLAADGCRRRALRPGDAWQGQPHALHTPRRRPHERRHEGVAMSDCAWLDETCWPTDRRGRMLRSDSSELRGLSRRNKIRIGASTDIHRTPHTYRRDAVRRAARGPERHLGRAWPRDPRSPTTWSTPTASS